MMSVGQKLWCDACWNSNTYNIMRVEAIGFDWVVCRDEYGTVQTRTTEGESITPHLMRFTTKPKEDDD